MGRAQGGLTWSRSPQLDLETSKTEFGTYILSRTDMDVAVLRFNGEVLRRSASDGSHVQNRRYAEGHHQGLIEREVDEIARVICCALAGDENPAAVPDALMPTDWGDDARREKLRAAARAVFQRRST